MRTYGSLFCRIARDRLGCRAAPPGQPTEVDYSVSALGTWANPGLVALILAGTSTVGTQAAAEHVWEKDPLDGLRERVNLTNGSNV